MTAFNLHRVYRVKTSAGTLSALVHEPPGFAEEPRPALLFLHGSEERGDDLRRVVRLGIPALIERGRNVPFVAISPQCPRARSWGDLTPALMELVEQLVPTLSIDARRLYLTGVSMGGHGAWKLAAEHPQRFAALAPVCGWGETAWAARLRDQPTWVFHGRADDVVPASCSEEMVAALERLGANVRLTLYDGVGHDAWTPAYDELALYDWMLGQHLPDLQFTQPAAP